MAAQNAESVFNIASYLPVGDQPLQRATTDFPDIKPDPEGSGKGDLDKAQKAIKHAAGDAFDEAKKGIAEIQPALWSSRKRALLVVFQGMDCSGKDTTINHVFAEVNIQGIEVSAFKSPTEDERLHDFMWRVHKQVPKRGTIGIFNRSHYEDVLYPYVNGLIDEKMARLRLGHIQAWELYLNHSGVSVVKIFLHISKTEQARRLKHRLDTPEKMFKLERSDFVERSKWDKYTEAYNLCISQTHSEDSPWFIVPADLKWQRDRIVAGIVHHALKQISPEFPKPVENIGALAREFGDALAQEIALNSNM